MRDWNTLMQSRPLLSDYLLFRRPVKTRVSIRGCVYKGICCEEVVHVLSRTTSDKILTNQVMACIIMADIGMVHIVMAYIVMAYIVVAYIVMAHIFMAYIAMAHRVMAYILWPIRSS